MSVIRSSSPSSPLPELRAALVPGVLLIAAVGLLQLATLRQGHIWGGDFALYISHAQNLAAGEPYGDVGYVFNPEMSKLGPRTYPPGFPAMLTPLVAAGLDIQGMKPFMVGSFVVFLLAFYACLRPRMALVPALAVLAIVALNPYLWEFRDRIQSDVPFLALLYIALVLLERVGRLASPLGLRGLGISALAGLAIYAAYATRSVGLILVPTFVLYELYSHRRLRAGSVVVIAVALGLGLVQETMVGTVGAYLELMGLGTREGSLLGQLTAVPTRLFITMPRGATWPFRAGLPNVVAAAGSLLVLAFAGWGFVDRVRRGPKLPEFFAVLYLGAIAVFPYTPARYFLPIVPLIGYYCVEGLRALPPKLPARARQTAAVLVALYVVGAGAWSHATSPWTELPEGPHRPEAIELFAFLKGEFSPERDVCVFHKPRPLTLFTGIPASIYTVAGDFSTHEAMIRDIGATCYVSWPEIEDSRYTSFVQSPASPLLRVFENEKFAVYRSVRRVR